MMVLLITVISIFITASIGFYFNYQMERENIYLAMESQVISLNADVNNWLDQKTQTIEVLGDVIEKNHLNKEEIRVLINHFNEDAEISDIYMGFSDGSFVSSIEWQPPKGYDPRQRPWYKTLLDKKQVAFSEPYLDITTGKYAVSVGRCILDQQGQVLGVLAEDILVETLFSRLSTIKFRDIGYVFMIDKNSNLLAHPDSTMKDTQLRNDPELGPLTEELIRNKKGIANYNFKGVPKVTAFQEVPRSGWIIGVTVPKALINAPLYQLIKQFAVIFIAISASAVWISYLLSRNLVGRINRLLEKTDLIAQGEFNQAVEVTGDDEITALSHSFNQMGDKIRSYITELDEYNRSLEYKVEKAAQEITERKVQLMEAEKLNSLSYLVSGVAHEMNTPIGNCIMLASYMNTIVDEVLEKIEGAILKKSDLEKMTMELSQCCHKLLSNLDTGKNLITDFKELSVEQISYTPVPLDIEGVLWRSFHQARKDSSVELELQITLEKDLTFISDTLRIYKLFCELMENSFQHAYEGKENGKINIQIQSDLQSGGYRIHFEDNGSGIEPHVLDKAFTPFFSTKFSGQHNGLGLSVVYNIVKSLSGDIRISNSATGGTLVEMVIEKKNAVTQGEHQVL